MSSSYLSEMSSSSCGTQQSPEVLPCQPQHYHCYRQSSQAQQPPEKNVVYQRVRTYSGPMNKVVQTLDPVGSGEVLSPLKTASSDQSLVWSDHSQVPQRQLCQRGGNLELVYSLPASLALFYRILSLGLHFYMQYGCHVYTCLSAPTSIPSPPPSPSHMALPPSPSLYLPTLH